MYPLLLMLFLSVVFTLSLVSADETKDDTEKYKPYLCDATLIGKTRLVNDPKTKTSDSDDKTVLTKKVNHTDLKGRAEVCWRTPVSWNVALYLWGTICSDKFGQKEKDAVCASLYYFDEGGKGSLYSVKEKLTTFNSAIDDQPIWLDSLSCKAGTETNLTKCTYATEKVGNAEEIANDCQHAQDVYLKCPKRIRCNYCDKQSCNYEVLAKNTKYDLCSKDQVYCTRQVVTLADDKVKKYMGCTAQSCQEWSEECEADTNTRKCLCNECNFDNCNIMFLDLYHTNLSIIGNKFYTFIEQLLEYLNLGVRLLLLDFSAYLSLFEGDE